MSEGFVYVRPGDRARPIVVNRGGVVKAGRRLEVHGRVAVVAAADPARPWIFALEDGAKDHVTVRVEVGRGTLLILDGREV